MDEFLMAIAHFILGIMKGVLTCFGVFILAILISCLVDHLRDMAAKRKGKPVKGTAAEQLAEKIEQLEKERDELETERHQLLTNDKQLESTYSQVSKALCGKGNATMDELLQAADQLKRERDAAVKDCARFPCQTCADRENGDLCTWCTVMDGERTNHVWRGVKEDNDGNV